MCENNCKGSRSLNLNKEPTHPEVTGRINALAKALDGLSPLRTIIHRGGSDIEKDPVNKAIDDIAKELSKLISPQD